MVITSATLLRPTRNNVVDVPGHFHLHDDGGKCYGDFKHRTTAEEAARAFYGLFRVMDLPHCIDVCWTKKEV